MNVEQAEMPMVGRITISLGISSYPDDSVDVISVLKYGDEMLYKAKNNGRNRVEVFEASI